MKYTNKHLLLFSPIFLLSIHPEAQQGPQPRSRPRWQSWHIPHPEQMRHYIHAVLILFLNPAHSWHCDDMSLSSRLLCSSADCCPTQLTAQTGTVLLTTGYSERRAELAWVKCSDEKYHKCVSLQFESNIWEFLLSSMYCWILLKLLFLTYNVKCQMCDLIVLGEPSNIMIMKDGTI